MWLGPSRSSPRQIRPRLDPAEQLVRRADDRQARVRVAVRQGDGVVDVPVPRQLLVVAPGHPAGRAADMVERAQERLDTAALVAAHEDLDAVRGAGERPPRLALEQHDRHHQRHAQGDGAAGEHGRQPPLPQIAHRHAEKTHG